MYDNHICFKEKLFGLDRWRHTKYDTAKMFNIWTKGMPATGEWDMAKVSNLATQFESQWRTRSNAIVQDIQNKLVERLYTELAALQQEFDAQAAQQCVKAE